MQAQNPDSITDDILYLQKWVCQCCPLRGSTSTWLKPMQILVANRWTEVRDLMEKVGERLKELNQIANPREEKQYQLSWTPQNYQWLSHQPKNTCELLCRPCYICIRGLASVWKFVLNPVETWCSRKGGCSRGVGGGEYPLRSKGEGEGGQELMKGVPGSEETKCRM